MFPARLEMGVGDVLEGAFPQVMEVQGFSCVYKLGLQARPE